MHVERERVVLKTGEATREIAYGLTSLGVAEAGPDELLNIVRRHWEVENRVHYVRDFSYDEDRCRAAASRARRPHTRWACAAPHAPGTPAKCLAAAPDRPSTPLPRQSVPGNPIAHCHRAVPEPTCRDFWIGLRRGAWDVAIRISYH